MIPQWYQYVGIATVILFAVILTAAFIYQCCLRWSVYRSNRRFQAHQNTSRSFDTTSPCSFGYKIAWLAIQSSDTAAVAESLGISNPYERATWHEGINQAYNNAKRAYITPPVQGFTFVVGWWAANDDVNELNQRLENLSDQFGLALGFISQRISSVYGFFKAENGQVIRSLLVSEGMIKSDIGKVTETETAIFGEKVTIETIASEIDEDCVIKAAEAWSINPTKLDGQDQSKEYGILWQPHKN